MQNTEEKRFKKKKMAGWDYALLLLVAWAVSGEISLPCNFVGDVKISYKHFHGPLVIPVDLRDETLSLTVMNEIISDQVSPLCTDHLIDVTICSKEIMSLVYKSLESSCPSNVARVGKGAVEVFDVDVLNSFDVSFEGSDHVLPKRLPCDWRGSINVNIHNIDVSLPVEISVNGTTGAPVKSFAQIYSFLRESLNSACDTLIESSPEYSLGTRIMLHNECLKKMTTAFEEKISSSCPLVEKSFDDVTTYPNIEMNSNGDLVLHVRSLAGDEVEHFWHLMLAELLPSVSMVLQLLDGLESHGVSLDDFLSSHRRITVLIHNALRPWGDNPIHKFYDEVIIDVDGLMYEWYISS
jgi:hypothetical protein